jgi:YHS domain-containing protein
MCCSERASSTSCSTSRNPGLNWAGQARQETAPGTAHTSRHIEEDGMAMVTDPVCGMRIDTDDAVATAEHEGQTYYFCSQACHDAFVADPASYLA